MNLDADRPVVVLDTSAMLEILGWRASSRTMKLKEFNEAVVKTMGAEAQLVFHPVSLAEISTNSHEEVLLGRRNTRTVSREQIRRRHKLHQFALITLRNIVDPATEADPWPTPHMLIPELGDWNRLTDQRSDFRFLRCTVKSGVVPVATMVDHMILSLAHSLRLDGYNAGLSSGDQELLGAAEELQVPRINVHNLKKFDGYVWKSCNGDKTCIGACTEGEVDTDCETQFLGSSTLR